METTTGVFYAMIVVVGAQSLGFCAYHFYYLSMCCLSWQALRILAPNWTTNIELQVGWYTLKGVTTTSRQCKPVLDYVTHKLMGVPDIRDSIHIVGNDGEILGSIDVDPPIPPKIPSTKEPAFVLYEWHSKDVSNHAAHFVRFKTVKGAVTSSVNFKLSKIKFLAPQIIIHYDEVSEPERFDMSSELSLNNYYICGNRLFDKPFIAWYLKKHHDISLTPQMSYTVEFVDNTMIPQKVTSTQVVVINRDSYEISQLDVSSSPLSNGLRHRKPTKDD